MTPQAVYQAVAATLVRLGVDTVFGLIGETNMRLVSSMVADHGIRYRAARHEAGALGMADAFARASRRPGVATVSGGPGFTNAMTALTEAVKGRTPLLVLLGEPSSHVRRHAHELDHRTLVDAIGAGWARVADAAAVVEEVATGFRRAVDEQRPVVVALTTDVQREPTAADGLERVTSPALERAAPDPAAITAAADLVQRARLPVVLAGRGAAQSGARAALEALADRIGAVLAHTGQGKGVFAGSPWSVGTAGFFSSRDTARLLARADLVLAFGASLNWRTTRRGQLFAEGTRAIQCDADAAAIGALSPIDVGIVGDASLAAQALADELARRGHATAGFREDGEAQRVDGRVPVAEEPPDDGGGRPRVADPTAILAALDRMLPRERSVVVDSGHFMGDAGSLLSVPDAEGWIFTQDFQAVGLGLGSAVGAAVARPERLTVLVTGDGGASMGLAELETAVRYGLPILIVVLNDHAYGTEVHLLRNEGLPPELALFPEVDFARLAGGIGIPGTTVRRVADLEALRRWLSYPAGPYLLDCKLDPNRMADWAEQALNGWRDARS